jgi:hypothetical protein
MTLAFGSAGANGTGTTSVAPGYPSPAVHDTLVLWVATKAGSITAPDAAVWTPCGSGTLGSMIVAAFVTSATGTEGTSTITVNIPSGTSSTGKIVNFTAATGSYAKVQAFTTGADSKDLVFITGDIQDANGVLVPNAESSVSFSVSGPGQLVGVDNGNPTDTTSYKGTSRKAFSGKVLAIVRSTGSAGTIMVTASSSGLTSASVTATAQTVP